MVGGDKSGVVVAVCRVDVAIRRDPASGGDLLAFLFGIDIEAGRPENSLDKAVGESGYSNAIRGHAITTSSLAGWS